MARFFTILLSGAVVIADIILFFVFRNNATVLPPPWPSIIPLGIVGLLLFALVRLRRQIRLFQEDR